MVLAWEKEERGHQWSLSMRQYALASLISKLIGEYSGSGSTGRVWNNPSPYPWAMYIELFAEDHGNIRGLFKKNNEKRKRYRKTKLEKKDVRVTMQEIITM